VTELDFPAKDLKVCIKKPTNGKKKYIISTSREVDSNIQNNTIYSIIISDTQKCEAICLLRPPLLLYPDKVEWEPENLGGGSG
jgi:hypothetical protein